LNIFERFFSSFSSSSSFGTKVCLDLSLIIIIIIIIAFVSSSTRRLCVRLSHTTTSVADPSFRRRRKKRRRPTLAERKRRRRRRRDQKMMIDSERYYSSLSLFRSSFSIDTHALREDFFPPRTKSIVSKTRYAGCSFGGGSSFFFLSFA
jgi:hypothetical protein